MIVNINFQDFLALELLRYWDVAVYANLTGKDILDEFAKKSPFGEGFLQAFANVFFEGLCPSKKDRQIPFADLQSGAWIHTLIQDAEEAFPPDFRFRCLCQDPHPPYIEGLRTFDPFSWKMPDVFLTTTLEKFRRSFELVEK